MSGEGRRKSLVGPTLATLVALAVLVALGVWQLQRKTWKEGLIDTLSHRLADAPMALPAAGEWRGLDANALEFRRVVLRPDFVPGEVALVYTNGSTMRSDVSGPGYWVLAPARIPGGGTVVVNRGFVPEGKQGALAELLPWSGGDIVGALRWPEAREWFLPDDEPAKNLWFVRDPVAIAAAKNWGPVAPFLVEQEGPPSPGGLPQVGRLQPNLPNNHMQYALTWFGLALVLVGVYIAFVAVRVVRPQPNGEVARSR